MTVEAFQTKPLVLDNGTGFTKNGFAGYDRWNNSFKNRILTILR